MLRKSFIAILFVGSVVNLNAQQWNYGEPVKLGGTINSAAEESIPVFSKDRSMLYFVRTMDSENSGGEMDQDIWYSMRNKSGDYTDCKRLTDFNNKFNNAVISLTGNGKSMYLLSAYEGKKDLQKGVARAQEEASGWSSPEKVEIPGLDVNGDFYCFYVNEAENVLILSFEGSSSLGKEDLYVCTKTGGSWSAPMHMGSSINSAGFEISPFLSESQDTLFFSSNGFGGEGDADIFFSVKQGSWSNWSKPQNLGSKINSPKFDAYFSLVGNQAYWTSNKDGELSDIYMLEIIPSTPLVVSCTAKDASTHKGSDGSIQLSLSGGVEPYSFAWSNGSAEKDLSGLNKGSYTVKITDAAGQIAENVCVVNEPAEVVLTYSNPDFKHTFGYNKNSVKTSNEDLQEFLQTLEKQFADGREKATITIISSASEVPTKTFGTNVALAQSRADKTKEMLETYFAKTAFKTRVVVTISEVKVQGPAYESDASNEDRYFPYQFIQLTVK